MCTSEAIDIVVNTWPFTKATDSAWCELKRSQNAVLTVERGCTEAEYDLTIPTVGYGGSPDEEGNVTLDALIMDGDTMESGAVASMPHIKNAIKVAHYVMKYTRHALLVGEKAAEFAKGMGFRWETLETENSNNIFKKWQQTCCQPNYRKNVIPDPAKCCGPYKPKTNVAIQGDQTTQGNQLLQRIPGTVDENHHDTIGMVALIGKTGSMAAGTSTNGASHRIAGRVGDSPIVGAGAYVDSTVGGAAGTGDGDVMARFLLSYQTVEYMRQGLSPTQAATKSLLRVAQRGRWYGALVALSKTGEYGGACIGFKSYSISIRSNNTGHSTITENLTCF